MAQFITFLHFLPSTVSSFKKVFLKGEIVRGPAISVSLTLNLSHSPKWFVSDCQHCTISLVTVEEI